MNVEVRGVRRNAGFHVGVCLPVHARVHRRIPFSLNQSATPDFRSPDASEASLVDFLLRVVHRGEVREQKLTRPQS
jgi:hypothetical protein